MIAVASGRNIHPLGDEVIEKNAVDTVTSAKTDSTQGALLVELHTLSIEGAHR